MVNLPTYKYAHLQTRLTHSVSFLTCTHSSAFLFSHGEHSNLLPFSLGIWKLKIVPPPKLSDQWIISSRDMFQPWCLKAVGISTRRNHLWPDPIKTKWLWVFELPGSGDTPSMILDVSVWTTNLAVWVLLMNVICWDPRNVPSLQLHLSSGRRFPARTRRLPLGCWWALNTRHFAQVLGKRERVKPLSSLSAHVVVLVIYFFITCY